jgi:hypothetical protein
MGNQEFNKTFYKKMEEFISYTMPRHIICLQQLSLAKNITFHNIESHNTSVMHKFKQI